MMQFPQLVHYAHGRKKLIAQLSDLLMQRRCRVNILLLTAMFIHV